MACGAIWGYNCARARSLTNYMRCLEYRRMSRVALRAARANRVFQTDKKRIRLENTVMVNTKHNAKGLYKIVNCVRICFSSARN